MKKLPLIIAILWALMSLPSFAWKVTNTLNTSVSMTPTFPVAADTTKHEKPPGMNFTYGRSYSQGAVNLSFNVSGGMTIQPEKKSDKDSNKNSVPVLQPMTFSFNATW